MLLAQNSLGPPRSFSAHSSLSFTSISLQVHSSPSLLHFTESSTLLALPQFCPCAVPLFVRDWLAPGPSAYLSIFLCLQQFLFYSSHCLVSLYNYFLLFFLIRFTFPHVSVSLSISFLSVFFILIFLLICRLLFLSFVLCLPTSPSIYLYFFLCLRLFFY